MPSLRGPSVRRMLATTTMVAVGAALLLAGVAFVAYDIVSFRTALVTTLSVQAEIAGRQTTSALVFQDPDAATQTLRSLRADPRIVAACVYDASAAPFAWYRRGGGGGPASPRAPGPEEGHAFEGGHLVLWRSISPDGIPLGTVLVESDLEALWSRLWSHAAIGGGVLLVSLLLAYAVATHLQRVIARPVLQLVETAEAVSSRQDYGVRAVGAARGELGLLVHTFNHMLDQIQERDAALHRARDDLERQVEEQTRDLRTEVAERRLLEEELRSTNKELEQQSRRVQQATRLKSEFLANMSHELRTPLNGVIGFSELLHDGRVGPVSAQQRECLADILASSRHLLQLINDILDLAKVEAGKMEFRPEAVDLPKLVGEVRDILRTLSAKKRITIAAESQAGPAQVTVDPGKLKQVLYNFLSNAIKFTPDEGRVVVRTAIEPGDRFRLEVQDNGIGIREEDLGLLFVEFQQLDAGSDKAHGGTGLGLALTKRIVEAQGGEVGVESRLGSGSTFYAVLPTVTGPAQPGLPLAAVGSEPPSEGTILVVEDDAEERRWLVQTLSEAGYTVEQAASGREALERCRSRAFDGITLDVFLPDTTGWDVLRELRRGGRNQGTPVIVVTVVAEKGASAGFAIHDYLVKPVRAGQLLRSLRRAGAVPSGSQPILVVDDDPHVRKLLAATLDDLGFRALTVATAEEGIQVAAAERPAAVILDLLLPEMDGFGFLERFRGTAAGRTTPVIVWTAKDLGADDHARLARSSQGIVLKKDGEASRLIDVLRLHVAVPGGAGGRDAADREEGADGW